MTGAKRKVKGNWLISSLLLQDNESLQNPLRPFE